MLTPITGASHWVIQHKGMTACRYNATGKVRLMAKNIGFRMELLGTPKVRLGVPA